MVELTFGKSATDAIETLKSVFGVKFEVVKALSLAQS